MLRLYSVSICTLSLIGTKPIAVDNKLSTLGDWIRFNSTQWFVWTDRSKDNLAAEVKSVLEKDDQLVVVIVEPEFAQGHAPAWVWNWLNDKMSRRVIGS